MRKWLCLFVAAFVSGLSICVSAQVARYPVVKGSSQGNLYESADFGQIVDGVLNIQNPIFSAVSMAQVADLAWGVDEQSGRVLFYKALAKLSVGEKDGSGKTSFASASFRKIIALIAKHDKKWAEVLLESRFEDLGGKANTNLNVAEDLLDSDPKLASDFARQSLQVEIDPAFVTFLKRLRQQNQVEADRLFLQALTQSSRRLNANSFGFLGTYLFTSPQVDPQDLQSVPVTLVGNVFVPNISINRSNIPINLVQSYLQNAVVLLNSPTNNPEERAVRYALANLLLPKAQEFAPGLIGPLGGAMAPLASAVPPELTSADAYKNITRKPYDSPQARMDDIDKIGDSYTRNRLLLDFIYQAWRKNDVAAAKTATAKIEDDKVRNELESLITFREGASLLYGDQTNLVRAMQTANKMPVSTEKCLLWLGVASAAEKAIQPALVTQALNGALESARRLENEMSPFLLLYIAAQKKTAEPSESSLVFAEAIRSFNKFEAPPDPDLVHRVTLEPITLPFSIAVQAVNLDFQSSIKKFLDGNEPEGIRIVGELNDDRLKGLAYVSLTRLILAKRKRIASLSNQERVIRVGEDGIRKSAAKMVMPAYPKESLKTRTKGVAVSEIQYDGGGKVTDVKILQSPDAATAKSVEDALRQWEFTPSKLDDKPVSVRGKITFYFVVDAKGKGKVENPKQFQ